MPTQTQPWLRAELIAAPETTPGAQLMIPADGIEFHDDELVFHHQGDVVYVAPRGQLRSITWLARQPHPETARRKAQWPNHGTRWTDEERTELRRHLQAGHSWKTVSHAHGRSRTGCQQEAVKQGWLDSETLAPTAKLLGGEGAETDGGAQAEAKADHALASAPTEQAPNLALAADSVASAGLATKPADPPPSPAGADVSTGWPPNIVLAPAPTAGPGLAAASAHATAPADRRSSTDLAAASAEAQSNPPAAPSSIAPTEAWPSPQLADPVAVPPNFALAGTSDAAACPEPAETAVAIAREASARADTESQPDRPHIPHQRSESADLPDPEREAPPGPGSRFLSRAQSSLARATLGAYVNPPRTT